VSCSSAFSIRQTMGSLSVSHMVGGQDAIQGRPGTCRTCGHRNRETAFRRIHRHHSVDASCETRHHKPQILPCLIYVHSFVVWHDPLSSSLNGRPHLARDHSPAIWSRCSSLSGPQSVIWCKRRTAVARGSPYCGSVTARELPWNRASTGLAESTVKPQPHTWQE
jgi:hypothetical protein